MAKRGRPARDDDAVLQAAAMKLAKKEVSSRRSAIMQSLPRGMLGNAQESSVRRMQRKWKNVGEKMLAEAQAILDRQKRDRELEAQRQKQRIEQETYGSVWCGDLAGFSASHSSLAKQQHEIDKARALGLGLSASMEASLIEKNRIEQLMLGSANSFSAYLGLSTADEQRVMKMLELQERAQASLALIREGFERAEKEAALMNWWEAR